ncbi:hypothetical protein ACIO8F_41945 [Streptomyces sp. NPDC087228]|uniref:hypothetical protein n=1 Tax=Streptomyces sp. NPDC087228 TaxID=3365772 RepID=UPI0038094126
MRSFLADDQPHALGSAVQELAGELGDPGPVADLVAAREAAKKTGATSKKPKRRTGTVVRRDGREPLGLGSAISRMMTERGMVAPAAGGSVLARFEAILTVVVPELAGRRPWRSMWTPAAWTSSPTSLNYALS